MQQVQTPIRVGVIGLGFAGATALRCYAGIPEVEILGLAGLEEDRLQELGATYKIPNLLRDPYELLDLPGLNAVSVAVPNNLHAPLAIAALERGLHVLCEKPLARTAAEAQAMVQAAGRANRVLQVVFNHRQRGDVQLLKQVIDEGTLGHVYYAKAYWMRRRGIPGLGSWFVSKEGAGGGCLIDLGVHVLDMCLYLLGEPEVVTVSASTYDELGRRGVGFSPRSRKTGAGNTFSVEDLATAFMRLSTGGTVLLEASWATHSSFQDDYGVVLYGTDGGAEIRVQNYGTEDTLRIYKNVAEQPAEIRPRVPPSGFHEAVVRQFIDRILSGNWSVFDGSDGLRYAQVIDACYASALQGAEVVIQGVEAEEVGASAAS